MLNFVGVSPFIKSSSNMPGEKDMLVPAPKTSTPTIGTNMISRRFSHARHLEKLAGFVKDAGRPRAPILHRHDGALNRRITARQGARAKT